MKTTIVTIAAAALATTALGQTWYGIEFQSGNLYSVDIQTQSSTFIGVSTVTNGGLAHNGVNLYALQNGTGDFGTIDTNDGSFNVIGNAGFSNESLAYDPVNDRFLANAGSRMYAINPNDGSSTDIGGVGGGELDGLSVLPVDTQNFTAGTIFGVDSGTLYTLDIQNNTRTNLGATWGNETLAFGPDGTLYVSEFGDEIRARDVDTGVENFAFNSGGNGELVMSAVNIPAPASAALLGLAGLTAARRRR